MVPYRVPAAATERDGGYSISAQRGSAARTATLGAPTVGTATIGQVRLSPALCSTAHVAPR
jgi:hypothetical protein